MILLSIDHTKSRSLTALPHGAPLVLLCRHHDDRSDDDERRSGKDKKHRRQEKEHSRSRSRPAAKGGWVGPRGAVCGCRAAGH